MDAPLRRRTDLQRTDPSPLRALVVDDDEHYCFYISAVVSRFGFAVTTAADGEAAMHVLRDGAYDLLVVDCEMPRLGGLEFIQNVRATERYAEVYAVMLTAREDVETKIAALRLGYDDFIGKSSSELEIAAKLSAARRLVMRQRRMDAAVRELYGLATRDELTGLYNRRFFFAEAERMLAEGTVVNLVLFDLDDFKRVNDTYGHLAGDRILRDLGALFLARTRHDDLIARYGGDELVMLIPALGPPEVDAIAARIAAEVGVSQWTFGSDTFSLSVTTGMAYSSLLPSPTVSQLLSAGDRDLYKNKWIRRNPDLDPSLYTYDAARDAAIIELELERERERIAGVVMGNE